VLKPKNRCCNDRAAGRKRHQADARGLAASLGPAHFEPAARSPLTAASSAARSEQKNEDAAVQAKRKTDEKSGMNQQPDKR
jgi:hypothetical protein